MKKTNTEMSKAEIFRNLTQYPGTLGDDDFRGRPWCKHSIPQCLSVIEIINENVHGDYAGDISLNIIKSVERDMDRGIVHTIISWDTTWDSSKVRLSSVQALWLERLHNLIVAKGGNDLMMLTTQLLEQTDQPNTVRIDKLCGNSAAILNERRTLFRDIGILVMKIGYVNALTALVILHRLTALTDANS